MEGLQALLSSAPAPSSGTGANGIIFAAAVMNPLYLV
jgi:hypothetical protein